MPYKVSKKGSGYKVTTPNHPQGFSKKAQTAKEAYAQKAAIEHSTGENDKGEKVKPAHQEWADKVKGKRKK